MIMKANKQIGFIYKDNESIDKILKDGDVIFERGFLREKTSTTLPITFGGVGKDLKDYKIYGNTYQNSTSGKNLCGVPNQTTTLNGITAIVENGEITLNGTASDSVYIYYTPISSTILNGYYTLNNIYISGNVSSTGTKNFNVRRADTKANIFGVGYIEANSNNTRNFTTDTEIIFGIYIQARTEFSNYKFRPQLVAGTEPDYDYEPYTGGQPSPNPDYPQEIISCGDRTKNLFDINLSQSTGNATKSVDGNNLTITCNANNQNCYVSYDTSNINPNKTYYFSYTAVADNYAGVMIRAYKNDNTYEVAVDFTQTTEANLNFNVPDNTVYLRTFLYASRLATGGSIGDKTIYSNVHLGEDPYGYKIPVNVRSDNLFDKDNANIINAFLYNNKCSIREDYGDRTLILLAKPNTTYTVSRSVTTPTFRVAYTNNDLPTATSTRQDVNVEGQITDENASSITITTGNLVKYLLVCYGHTRDTNINESLASIQIVEGSTVPSKYIPYYNETTNMYLDEPLRKIDEYSDYIDFINGKVVRNIKEMDMSIITDWGKNNTSPASYYRIGAASKYNFKIDKLISNIFTYSSVTWGDNYKIGITNSGNLWITPGDSSLDNAEDVPTWLQNKNAYMLGILATSTEESITLPNIPTVDENNTLNIETEITPSQVYIKYKSNN